MSGDVVCDCSLCPCGAPKKFKLTISGVTGCGDTPCVDCGVDGEYYLEQQAPLSPCGWRIERHYEGCWGTNAWALAVLAKNDCTLELDVSYYTKQGHWKKAGIAHCWADRYELTGGAECFPGVPGVPSCQFPNTITVEPVGIYSLEDTDCIRCQTCDKPTNAPEPEVGPPACQLDKCHCAACEAAREQAAIRIPRPLGGTGACGCASGCDVGLNVNNGNLSVRLGMPDAGSLAPADVLSYHSRSADASPLGYGVQSGFTPDYS